VGKHFLHFLEYSSDCVKISGAPESIQSAYLLRDGTPLPLKWKDGKLELCIPPALRDPFDTVAVLA
jgi:hypothetical protein